MRTALQPPEPQPAILPEQQKERDTLAADYAALSFDTLDLPAQAWLADQYGEDDLTRLIHAAILGVDITLAVDALRTRYVEDNESKYRDRAWEELRPVEYEE